MPSKHILGLDIGGTKSAVVCGTAEGEILSRTEFPTEAGGPFQDYFQRLCEAISATLRSMEDEPKAISVSIGGPLDVLQGIIMSPPNLPGWDDIPLKQLLKDRFNLPVYVEHDGNAGALAEYYFGAGKGKRSVVFLTLGTGLGAGLILDGRLYRGTSYVAGEIGHIRIADDGPESYGKKGSLEGYCSGNGIEKLASILFPKRWPDPVSTRELGALAKKGDADAVEVFSTSGRYLGRGLAIIADLINPEMIILGALGVRMGPLLMKAAMEVFKKESLSEASNVCEIVPARLGEKIGDIAALCAAIDQGGMR